MLQKVKQSAILTQVLYLKQQFKTKAEDLNYLTPSKHAFFAKQYKLQTFPPQIHTLTKDLLEYQLLLHTQFIKMTECMKNYNFLDSLTQLISILHQFAHQFSQKNIQMLIKMTKKLNIDQNMSKNQSTSTFCSSCLRGVELQKIQNMTQELSLNVFQDRYNLYNIDYLNLGDLAKIRRQSRNLLDSELLDTTNKYDFIGNCISYEQYEEVLNLLGSDIYAKNSSIEKIIDYMKKTEERIIDEQLSSKREEIQMQQFQVMVEDDAIKNKVRLILKKFYQRLNQYRKYHSRDFSTQVSLKENDIIRELEKEKKELKKRIRDIETDKLKQYKLYDQKVANLQKNIQKMNVQHSKTLQAMESSKIAEQQQKSQLQHMNDLLRKELHDESIKYAEMIQNLTNKAERRISALNKNSRGKSSKSFIKQNSKKILVKRGWSNQADLDWDEDKGTDRDIQQLDGESFKQNRRKSRNTVQKNKRKISLLQQVKGSQGIKSVKDFSKLGTYQKIQQKNQQEETDQQFRERRTTQKKKTSRFKALASFISRKQSIYKIGQEIYQNTPEEKQNTTKIKTLKSIQQKNSGSHALMSVGTKGNMQNSQDRDEQQPRICILPSESQKVDILRKLYELQNEKASFKNISTQTYIQLYNNFMDNILNLNGISTPSAFSQAIINSLHRSASRSQKTYLSLPKNQSYCATKQDDLKRTSIYLRDGSRRQSVTNNKQEIKSGIKLQPLDKLAKHSNFYMKKTKKVSQFQSYNNSTLTPNTISNFNSSLQMEQQISNSNHCLKSSSDLSEILDVKNSEYQSTILRRQLFTSEQIAGIFANAHNIAEYHKSIFKTQTSIFSLQQNHFIMRLLALFAQLHVQNQQIYNQIKHILYYPTSILHPKQEIKNHLVKLDLKMVLKYLLTYHRKCKSKTESKGMCPHLNILQQKLMSVIITPVSHKQNSQIDKQAKQLQKHDSKLPKGKQSVR